MTSKELYEKIKEIANSKGFHFHEEEWGSGYFIMEFGEDTVVHFRVKECRGWLFGIWFKDYETKGRHFEMFGQPLNAIDKFKPTASYFCYDSSEDESDNQEDYMVRIRIGLAIDKVISPVRYDWAMAWYLSDNYEYPVSRHEAKMKLLKYRISMLWKNFMGDVGIDINDCFTTFDPLQRHYPFKCVTLFFKYLGRKEKPAWNKL